MKLTISTAEQYSRAAARSRRAALRRLGSNIIFLLPAFVIFSAFVIYPILGSFYYSLTSWNGLDPGVTFVGFSNFRDLLSDSSVLGDIKNTLVFAASVMVAQNGIALLLALILDGFLRRFAFLRVLFLLPVLLSSLAIAYTWSYLYNPLFGFINIALAKVGLGAWAQDWLGDAHLALPSIIATNTWQWVGYSMIIFLAGLQAVPSELYEAANIDGAQSWQRFYHVTFPLIAPALTVNVVLTLIGSLKVFDLIFVMTGGGPAGASESLALRLYKEAFTLNHFGYATAIGVVMSFVILAITVLSLLGLRRREIEL